MAGFHSFSIGLAAAELQVEALESAATYLS